MLTYAILGATGKVGFATSSTLRKSGHRVRAILHDARKTDRLKSIGCEVVVADLHDAASLTKALEAADAVQVVLPLNPGANDPPADMRDAMDCLIQALEATRPNRLLLISDYGAHVTHDIGMPSMFHTFEERLSQLDCHKTFLRSAEHIQNWGRAVPIALASGTLHTFQTPIDATFPVVSAQDVGTISADLLMLPVDGKATEIVHVEGPHRYSAKDVAEAISELVHRTIVAEHILRSQWDEIFKRDMSSSLAELLIRTNDAQNEGGLIDVEEGVGEIRHGTTELKDALRVLLDL